MKYDLLLINVKLLKFIKTTLGSPGESSCYKTKNKLKIYKQKSYGESVLQNLYLYSNELNLNTHMHYPYIFLYLLYLKFNFITFYWKIMIIWSFLVLYKLFPLSKIFLSQYEHIIMNLKSFFVWISLVFI